MTTILLIYLSGVAVALVMLFVMNRYLNNKTYPLESLWSWFVVLAVLTLIVAGIVSSLIEWLGLHFNWKLHIKKFTNWFKNIKE